MVLDDDYSGTSLTGIDEEFKHPLAARVVLCPVGVGLTVEHLPVILDALRRPFAENSKDRDDLPESERPGRNVWCRQTQASEVVCERRIKKSCQHSIPEE